MTKDEDIEKVAEESTEVGDETEDDEEMDNGVEECTDQHEFKPLTLDDLTRKYSESSEISFFIFRFL